MPNLARTSVWNEYNQYSVERRCAYAQPTRAKEIWQRRFWKHVTRDDTDDRRHIDDIHYNPVRHAYELANVLNLL